MTARVSLVFNNGRAQIDLGHELVDCEPGWIIEHGGSRVWAPAREWRRSARWSTPERLALVHESLTVYTFDLESCRVLQVSLEGGHYELRYAR